MSLAYLTTVTAERVFNVRFQRVGGIRFLSIGRFRFSFCIASGEPAPRKSRRQINRAIAFKARSEGWQRGYNFAKREG